MALRDLEPAQIARILGEGGLLIDLRPTGDYLARHLAGSIPLLYEAGPGLGGRARDLLPLDARLVLLEDGVSSMEDAAAAFRGKGFDVAGFLPGGVEGRQIPSHGGITATPEVAIGDSGRGRILLNVADPGAVDAGSAELIPAERLWERGAELDRGASFGVLAGWGVRAAAAIGILEHLGFENLAFVRTRPPGAKPATAGPEVFRVGGPG